MVRRVMTVTMPAGVQTARDLVGPAIAEAVAKLSPNVRAVAAYHLGLAEADGRPTGPGTGAGKALRPALALLSARSAGFEPERAVVPAVAVELVHNFSLLHDDIMDGDTERRHRPTAWTVFGVGGAILAGDALLVLAQDMLLETQPYGMWAARCLSAAVQRLIAGQGADLAFERRDDVQVAECLEMAGDKTAALMACACSIGVIYCGASANLAMSLSGFGAHAGLAFQLADDLLGIWGAPEVTGKPVGSDLRARKKSVPVVTALTSGSEAGSELAKLLARPESLTDAEVRQATALVETAGGKEQTEAMADAELSAALGCLAAADMPEDVRSEFAAIAEFITARQW
jgi:geranylgeranyl diphosphate synthase, type I